MKIVNFEHLPIKSLNKNKILEQMSNSVIS